jgi:hypothetical protein
LSCSFTALRYISPSWVTIIVILTGDCNCNN